MKQTLIVLVDDHPAVLNRVASLIRRRSFTLESLTICRTAEPGLSRITIVVDGDADIGGRLVTHLEKLVDVLDVEIEPLAALQDAKTASRTQVRPTGGLSPLHR